MEKMKYKVLIVDDEEIVCRGLAQFVKWQEHGFEVAGIAHSVEEALLQMEHTDFSVIFLDIRMPGKTGLDMLQELRESYPAVKTVILSGFSEFSYAREAIRYGAVDYLSKPVNLKEVEALLERLRQELVREREDYLVRNNRVEGLLTSIVKGFTEAQPEKYQLPELRKWYGCLARLLDHELTEEEILRKKELLRKEIKTVVPDSVILNESVYGLFAIIPYEDAAEPEHFVSLLEQACLAEQEWACGISKFKHGIQALRESYQEAERAFRYQRAGEKYRIVWYQNIASLFVQNAPEIQDILKNLVGGLANPQERTGASWQLREALDSLCLQQPALAQFQAACIGCLIEMNGLLEGMKPKGIKQQPELNAVLERILLSSDHQATIGCMMDYVDRMAAALCSEDESLIGKGVIREVQLFIQKNYSENITLNLLADQFYLHPNYLSKLFKEKTGKNFVEYMTEVRMEQAKKLLRDPDNRIADISTMVGYDNTRYFNKVFKQHTEMTPSEYRETLPV